MVRIISLIFVLVVSVVVHPIAASAQDTSCYEVQCRALGFFRTCNRPREGANVFSARVLALSKECSNNILSVKVDDGKANNLPTVVEIDLGPCVRFSGEVGDVIQIALVEPHRPDLRRYGLACRIW